MGVEAGGVGDLGVLDHAGAVGLLAFGFFRRFAPGQLLIGNSQLDGAVRDADLDSVTFPDRGDGRQPAAASGETWPMDSPEVPPEKRPSVTRAHAFPNPMDLR